MGSRLPAPQVPLSRVFRIRLAQYTFGGKTNKLRGVFQFASVGENKISCSPSSIPRQNGGSVLKICLTRRLSEIPKNAQLFWMKLAGPILNCAQKWSLCSRTPTR